NRKGITSEVPMKNEARSRVGKKSQPTVKWLTAAAAALAAAAMAAGLTAGSPDRDRDGNEEEDRGKTVAIGPWGGPPYSDLQATVGVPNLIADMNRQDLTFTVQDGDLKSGNGTAGSATPTTCSDALYVQALGFFNSLDAPAMLTPGDNDWTDCDRLSN